jgi:hypothetical protein
MKKYAFAAVALGLVLTQTGCSWAAAGLFGAVNVAVLDVVTALDFLNILPFN